MWALGWIAWIVAGAVLSWMVWDFMRVNLSHGEDALTGSREGVDELFEDNGDRTRAG